MPVDGGHWPGAGVRPTLRCLAEDLGIAPLPTLDRRLEDLDHELIRKAQSSPEVDAAGGSERIESVDDRVWLKAKTGVWRGAVLPPARQTVENDEPLWWLGAGGRRQADSPQADFYERFKSSCILARKSSAEAPSHVRTDSRGYLPTELDGKRLSAERALHFVRSVPLLVRRLARMSLLNGHVAEATFDGWQLRVLIRASGDHAGTEAYIVVGGSGLTDPDTFAVILSAIPGVRPGDWMAEPSEIRGLRPGSGEILFSALLPPQGQAQLLKSEQQN